MAARLTTRITHGDVRSPLGSLMVIATDRGVVRVAFEEDGHAAIDEVAERLEADLGGGSPLIAEARRELGEYFAGRLRRFTVPVDRVLMPDGFARRVLAATARIPYGRVATYGDVAARAGAPRAARAAGNALNANPVPIIVPCHRVVPASGGNGGYGGHAWRKDLLLDLEARA